MSRSIFDIASDFTGRHNPLRNGWSTSQLETVAKEMGLPGPDPQAIAFVACSLVAEERTAATALRYSRSPRNYSYLDAYEADPLMTYRRVIRAVDWLIAHGWAEGRKGQRWLGKQSIMWATPKLMARIGDLVDLTQRQGAMLRDEIILRDKGGNSLGFTDTAKILRMRVEMKSINAHLAQQQYLFDGTELYIPPAARIFNQTLRRGGRLYHQGSSYQQMPKEKRAKIHMLVDGVMSPTVELDFDNLHLALIYRAAGKKQPDGDLYQIDGFTRELSKPAHFVALNADGTEIGAITGLLSADEELCLANGLDHRRPTALRAAAERLIAAIRRKHYRVKEFFGSGVGAELMKADSDMAVRIMLAMIEQTGRCPLVLHDSFIVPVSDAKLLEHQMALALAQAGPSTTRSTTSQSNLSPSPIHLGNHSADQQGCVPTKSYREQQYSPLRGPSGPPGLDRLVEARGGTNSAGISLIAVQNPDRSKAEDVTR
ncbi:MAG: hypothetical protein JWR34_3409 [Mycobacterium sp.]|nr:hypothetical protein [Mycobacterium sp.]